VNLRFCERSADGTPCPGCATDNTVEVGWERRTSTHVHEVLCVACGREWDVACPRSAQVPNPSGFPIASSNGPGSGLVNSHSSAQPFIGPHPAQVRLAPSPELTNPLEDQ